MPELSTIAEFSWTDPRVLFLVGLILATVLGALVFVALQMERRRMLAESRQEDAERLGRAFAGTGLCFWDWDIGNGVFTYDHEWFASHLGYDNPHHDLGVDFLGAITHPEDTAQKNEALYRHLIGETESYSVELRLRKKNGSWIWILSRGKVFERDQNGLALRFAGADSIIDDQKLAESVLEIEKEVAVRYGEVYSDEGILEALAEGLVKLSEFEFALVFCREKSGQPLDRVYAQGVPPELDGIRRLERAAARNPLFYYEESDLEPLAGRKLTDPISVTELRIVRGGEVAGCIWVGSRGHSFPPRVVIEAIEQLEIQAQGALDRIESETFYRAGQRNLNTLINSIDEMILILDENYGIIYANDIVGTELGYERQQLLGINLFDLIPDQYRELARQNFDDLILGNLPICSAPFLRKGSGLMQGEVQISSGRWGESDAHFCVVRNAGRRDEAARALEQRDQQLRVAASALVELITSSDIENGIREAVSLLASFFGADRIYVAEKSGKDEEGVPPEFLQVCRWIRGASPPISLGNPSGTIRTISLPPWVECLRRGESVVVIRDNCSDEERECLSDLGVCSLLMVPIHLRDVWWGVMRAEMREEPREWSPGDVSLLEIVGSGLAGLVETMRLQGDLIQAKDQTERTNRDLAAAILRAQDMAEEASQANRSKTEFLANMSHEIRTPMNAILGFSELIESEITEPRLVEYLRAIRSSGKTLLALINDLLDLSKIEAGKMSLQCEPTALADLLQDMLNIFQVRCDEKGIALTAEIDPQLPPQLILDESRLRQIIFNLLGNAVKFTHQGKVELRVSCKPTNEGQHCVDLKIEVADTGIGIEKEDQASIFEPFEQSRGQRQKVYGGTGLGLSITSRLVKMMSGSLSLSSAVGQGSSFVVDLRGVSTVEMTQVSSGQTADGPARLNGFASGDVLVVDDNPLNRRMLGVSLQAMGVSVREASSGEECLKKLEEKRPDLILLDILMPGLSGGETAERIHRMEKFADLPIVACTALDLSRARSVSATARFDDILVKPISQGALRSVLGRFLTEKSDADPSSEEQSETSESEFVIPESAAVPAGTPAQLRELAEILDAEFLGDWTQLRRRQQIDPILTAANRMKSLGEAYGVPHLTRYADGLRHWAGLFDMEKLKELMDLFPLILERLRSDSEERFVTSGKREEEEVERK